MSESPLGLAALAAVLAYLGLLLAVAWRARAARGDDSLSSFYLAGRSLGPFVLFATLYATQYSGNSLLGYPGEAYRIGFAWVMSLGFMMGIIVAYLLVAPRLYLIARRHGYVTPGDWLDHRYGLPALTWTANTLTVVAIANYLLAQLMAMGHIVAGLSGGAVPYWVGVVGLTLVIVIYETVGGLHAVAWTDGVQGSLLLLGLAGVIAWIAPTPDRLGEITAWVAAQAPEKTAVPPLAVSATWLSTLIIVPLSAAVYPQAIQRIYAAKSIHALRRGITVMAFMPIVTMLPVLLLGIVGIQQLSGLEGVAADQVVPLLLRQWAAESVVLHALAVVVIVAVIAAIMSTADSVLLTLSSMLAKDFLGKTVLAGETSERLTRAGKTLSWVVVAVLVGVALQPRITLWGLTEFKMELLVQVAPAFILGLHLRAIHGRAALWGLLAGAAVALALPFTPVSRPFGVHDGLVGLVVNLAVCAWASAFGRRSRHEKAMKVC